jgi:hypothetical protein
MEDELPCATMIRCSALSGKLPVTVLAGKGINTVS